MTAYLTFCLSHLVLSLTRRSNYAAIFLFIVINLWFVGLHYEVGFDWELYKSQFEAFSTIPPGDFYSAFSFYQQSYGHEAGFLLLSYLAAHVVPTYEFFYLAIFVFFMISVTSLAQSIGSRNLIASFLFIHLFLLFTLEFSTLRQIVAISIFNIGLAAFFNRRVHLGYGLMVSATFFQLSALLYLFAFVASSGSKRRVWLFTVPAVLFVTSLSLVSLVDLPFLSVMGTVGAKLVWYFELREKRFSPNVLEQVFFLVFYCLLALWALYNVWKKPGLVASNEIIAKMILVMCVLALAFFGVNTIRNRIMYEIVVIASLSVFVAEIRLRSYVKPLLFGWGMVFLMVSLLKPTSYVYVPYQNYVIYEVFDLKSDGPERQERLRHDL